MQRAQSLWEMLIVLEPTLDDFMPLHVQIDKAPPAIKELVSVNLLAHAPPRTLSPKISPVYDSGFNNTS